MKYPLVSNYVLGSEKHDVKKYFPDSLGRGFNEVFKKTGVRTRHTIGNDEDMMTLALKASNPVIQKVGSENVECLILVTQSPFSTLPASTFYLHNKLGLPQSCLVFDLPHGCSGFVYGLVLGESLVTSGKVNNFLLVTSETYSKYIANNDYKTKPIFSDAASAMYFNKKNIPKILSTTCITDGSGANNLCLINDENKKDILFMDGIKVFNFTITSLPKSVKDLLHKSDIKLNDIDYFVFHQASSVVLKTIQNKIKISNEKMVYHLEHIGNTVSSTIPIGLIDLINQNKISSGSKLMLIGFGVGLSLYGSVIVLK